MFGADYLLGYSQGRSSAEDKANTNAIIARVIYGQRPVTVDQSYIDQLHAALASANATSDHNFGKAELFHSEALSWKDKAHQFRNEALYWRDQKCLPAEAEAKALREENAVLRDENAVLLARLKERNPDLAEEQAAHDETFREGQSLHRFRVIATSLIDASSPAAPTDPNSPNCSIWPRTPPTPSNAAICSLLFVTSRKKATDFVASPTLCRSPDFPRGVPSRLVLELTGASSGDMRLSDHAARSMI